MTVDRPDLPYFDGDRLDATNQWGDTHGTVDALSPWLINTNSRPNTQLSGETDWRSFERPAGSQIWISKVLDAKESGRFGALQITRTETAAEELIEYSVGFDSTAIANLDYRPLPRRVYFAAGQATAEVQVEAYDDRFQELPETILVGLTRSTTNSSRSVDRQNRSLRVLDNDAASSIAIVSIASTTPAQESLIARERTGTVTFSRTGNLAVPLKFFYEVSSDESAEPGIDFRLNATPQGSSKWRGEAEFPANQSTLVLPIEAIDDAKVEGVEWFSIQVTGGQAVSYIADTTVAWFVTIVDDDQSAKLPELREVRLADPRSTLDLRTAISPVIVGRFDPGVFQSGIIQFDHDGDQRPDGEVTVRGGANEVRYDLRSDPKFNTTSGFVELRYRSQFVVTGSEQNSAWKSFSFFLQPQSDNSRQVDVALLVDTGNPMDHSTSDPRIAVRRFGDDYAEPIRVEFDHDRDGMPDGEVLLPVGASFATYDPRAVDPKWPKSEARVNLGFRILTSDLASSEPAIWQKLQFFQETLGSSDLQLGPLKVDFPFPGKAIFSLAGTVLQTDGQPFGAVSAKSKLASHGVSAAAEVEPGTLGGVPLEGCEVELSTTDDLVANEWAGEHLVELEVDLDGDGNPDDSVICDAFGRFNIFLNLERVASHQIAVRIKQRSPDHAEPRFTGWQWIEVRDESKSEKVVRGLELIDDTGENRFDRVTSIVGFHGKVEGWNDGNDLGQIRWHLQGTTDLSGVVAIQSDGEFVVDADQIILAAQQKGVAVDYGPLSLTVLPELFNTDRYRWELSRSGSIEFVYQAPAVPSIETFQQNDTPSESGRLEFFGKVDREVLGATVIEWCDGNDITRVQTIPINADRRFQFDFLERLLHGDAILLRVVSTDLLSGRKQQGEWSRKSIFRLLGAPPGIPRIESIDFPDRDVGVTAAIPLVRTPRVAIRTTDVPATGLNLELIVDGDHSSKRQFSISQNGKVEINFDRLPEGQHVLQTCATYYDVSTRTLKSSDWITSEFQFARTPTDRPRIVSLALQNDSGAIGDGVTEDPTILGTLVFATPSTVVEIDENSDQTVDAVVAISESQRFVYRMQTTVFGDNRLQARVLDWDQERASYVRGEWVELAFVQADQIDRSPQIVSLNASLANSSEGKREIEVAGSVTFQHATHGLVAELDLDGDNAADSRTYVDEYGAFHWKIVWSGSASPAARVRIGDESLHSIVPFSNWSSTIVVDRTKQSPQPRISSIGLVRDDGEKSDDRRTSDPRIRGVVESSRQSLALVVEVDVNSDRIADRQFTVHALGIWEFVDSAARPGQNSVAFRLSNHDSLAQKVDSEWVPFTYVLLQPERGSEDTTSNSQTSLTLAQFTEIKELQNQHLAFAERTRLENLRVGAEARLDRDEQFVALDQEQREELENANAQFDRDLDAARQEFIENQGQRAEVDIAFDFKPMRWPAAPPKADFVIPADEEQPPVPFEVPVENGPEYPFEADPILQEAIEKNRSDLQERSNQIRLETQQKNRDTDREFEREQIRARQKLDEQLRRIEAKYAGQALGDSSVFDRIASEYYERTQSANRDLLRLRQQVGVEFQERVTVARSALDSATKTADLNFQNQVKPARQRYERLLLDSTATYEQVRASWLAFVRTNHEAGKELQKQFSKARLEFDRLIANAIRERDVRKAQGQSEFESQLADAAGELRRDLAQAMPEREIAKFRGEAERRAELLVAKSEFEIAIAKSKFAKLLKHAANASAEEMRLLEIESGSRVEESRLRLQAIERWHQQTGTAWTAYQVRVTEIEHSRTIARENATLAKQSAVAFERGDSVRKTLSGELDVKLETVNAGLLRDQRELELWLEFMQENLREEREIAIISASRELRQATEEIGADLDRSLKDADAAHEYGVSIAEAWDARVHDMSDARILRFGRNRVRGGQSYGSASGGGASPGGGGSAGGTTGGNGSGGNPANPGSGGTSPSPGTGGSGAGGPGQGSPSDDSTSAGDGSSGGGTSADGGGSGNSDPPSGGTGPGSNNDGGGGAGGGGSGGSGGNPRPGTRFSEGFEDTWEEVSPSAFAAIWLRTQQRINRANFALQNRNHDAQQVWHDAVQNIERNREVTARELENRDAKSKAAAQASYDLGVAEANRVWDQTTAELVANQELLAVDTESSVRRVEILQELSESNRLAEANEARDRDRELARAGYRLEEATRYRDQVRGWANALQSAWSALQYQNAESQLRLARTILESTDDRTREQQRVNLKYQRQLNDAHSIERLGQADALSLKLRKDASLRAAYRSSQIDNGYELAARRIVLQRNRGQKLSDRQFENFAQDVERSDEYQVESLRLSRELQATRGELWFAFTSSLAELKANSDATEGNLREAQRLGMITPSEYQSQFQRLKTSLRAELDRLSNDFNRAAFGLWDRYRTTFAELISTRTQLESNLAIQREIELYEVTADIDRQMIAAQIQKLDRDRELGEGLAVRRTEIALEYARVSSDLQSAWKKEESRLDNEKRLDDADVRNEAAIESLGFQHRYQAETQVSRDRYEISLLQQDASAKRRVFNQTGNPLAGYQALVADARTAKAIRSAQLRLEDLERQYAIQREGELDSQQAHRERIASENRTRFDSVRLKAEAESALQSELATAQAEQIEQETKSDLAAAVGIAKVELELAAKQIEIATASKQRIGERSEEFAIRAARLQRDTYLEQTSHWVDFTSDHIDQVDKASQQILGNDALRPWLMWEWLGYAYGAREGRAEWLGGKLVTGSYNWYGWGRGYGWGLEAGWGESVFAPVTAIDNFRTDSGKLDSQFNRYRAEVEREAQLRWIESVHLSERAKAEITHRAATELADAIEEGRHRTMSARASRENSENHAIRLESIRMFNTDQDERAELSRIKSNAERYQRQSGLRQASEDGQSDIEYARLVAQAEVGYQITVAQQYAAGARSQALVSGSPHDRYQAAYADAHLLWIRRMGDAFVNRQMEETSLQVEQAIALQASQHAERNEIDRLSLERLERDQEVNRTENARKAVKREEIENRLLDSEFGGSERVASVSKELDLATANAALARSYQEAESNLRLRMDQLEERDSQQAGKQHLNRLAEAKLRYSKLNSQLRETWERRTAEAAEVAMLERGRVLREQREFDAELRMRSAETEFESKFRQESEVGNATRDASLERLNATEIVDQKRAQSEARYWLAEETNRNDAHRVIDRQMNIPWTKYLVGVATRDSLLWSEQMQQYLDLAYERVELERSFSWEFVLDEHRRNITKAEADRDRDLDENLSNRDQTIRWSRLRQENDASIATAARVYALRLSQANASFGERKADLEFALQLSGDRAQFDRDLRQAEKDRDEKYANASQEWYSTEGRAYSQKLEAEAALHHDMALSKIDTDRQWSDAVESINQERQQQKVDAYLRSATRDLSIETVERIQWANAKANAAVAFALNSDSVWSRRDAAVFVANARRTADSAIVNQRLSGEKLGIQAELERTVFQADASDRVSRTIDLMRERQDATAIDLHYNLQRAKSIQSDVDSRAYRVSLPNVAAPEDGRLTKAEALTSRAGVVEFVLRSSFTLGANLSWQLATTNLPALSLVTSSTVFPLLLSDLWNQFQSVSTAGIEPKQVSHAPEVSTSPVRSLDDLYANADQIDELTDVVQAVVEEPQRSTTIQMQLTPAVQSLPAQEANTDEVAKILRQQSSMVSDKAAQAMELSTNADLKRPEISGGASGSTSSASSPGGSGNQRFPETGEASVRRRRAWEESSVIKVGPDWDATRIAFSLAVFDKNPLRFLPGSEIREYLSKSLDAATTPGMREREVLLREREQVQRDSVYVDDQTMQVYWATWVSARNRLGRERVAAVPIGSLRDHGWVYLNNGSRAMLSALQNLALRQTGATPEQIEQTLDAATSPYQIDMLSKQIGIFIGGTGMHIYGVGNVERLYNLYSGTKFYYGGVGNPVDYQAMALRGGNLLGGGAGLGWSDLIDRIVDDVEKFSQPGQKVHIFGWSRGAAIANELARRLGKLSVHTDFLGMFDTVYSNTFPGQDSRLVDSTYRGFYGNYVEGTIDYYVRTAASFYAVNEDRTWFPATRFAVLGDSRLITMKSPGAHGEIGGHFASNMFIQRLNMRMMIDYAKQNGEALFRNSGLGLDVARILSSPLSVAIATEGTQYRARAVEQWSNAVRHEMFGVIGFEEIAKYFRGISKSLWLPGGYGTQKGNYNFASSPMILRDRFVPHFYLQYLWDPPEPKLGHHRRELDWVQLELLDFSPLRSLDTSDARRKLHELYSLKIRPTELGGWLEE